MSDKKIITSEEVKKQITEIFSDGIEINGVPEEALEERAIAFAQKFEILNEEYEVVIVICSDGGVFIQKFGKYIECLISQEENFKKLEFVELKPPTILENIGLTANVEYNAEDQTYTFFIYLTLSSIYAE